MHLKNKNSLYAGDIIMFLMNSVFRNSLAIAIQAGTKQYIKNNSKSDLVSYTNFMVVISCYFMF